jgi:hypothetical protein
MGTRRADLNEVRGTGNEKRMADGRRMLVGDERGSGSGAEGMIYPAVVSTLGTGMTTIRNYLKIFIGFFQVGDGLALFDWIRAGYVCVMWRSVWCTQGIFS